MQNHENQPDIEHVPTLHTLPARIGLGLILLLATGLRFYRLAGQSLWADEGNSVALARAGLAEIAARTALDIHPPLYYWLLHGWMRVLGQSEVAVRSLSALAGILLVAVVYRIGSRLFPPSWAPTAVLAAFVAAVSPFQVHYAQEARMYTLLALWGALVVWASVELTSDKEPGRVQPAARRPSHFTRYLCLYLLSATLGLYTHYAFPVLLVAANVAVLANVWNSPNQGRVARRLAGCLGWQLVPLALYLPWLPTAWRQLTTWPAPPVIDLGNAWLSIWRTLISGPAGLEVSALWLIGFGLLGMVGVGRLAWEMPLSRAALLLLYLGLPVGLTLILFKPAYLKFLLVASPALCLLLAVGLAGGQARRRAALGGWLGVALVAIAAWGPLRTYYTDPAVARDDYRGMARYLDAVAGPEDAIILNAAGQQEVFGYYYQGDTPVYPLPHRRPLDVETTVAELEAILTRSQRVFVLYWATDESDPARVIEAWLDHHAFKATDAWVGNVRLVSYATPLPAQDLLPADMRLGKHVTLAGYRLLAPVSAPDAGLSQGVAASNSLRSLPGEIVQVQLRWTTDALLDTHYVVFLQALDSANHLAGQRDAEPALPTPDWEPGLPLLDRHGLLIEPGTPPGEYRIIAGLYDAASGQRLPTASGDSVELGKLIISRPAAPPPLAALRFDYAASVDLGPLRLLGYDRYKLGHSYDPDTPLRAGDALHVVLYWQAQGRPQANWLLGLQMAPVAHSASPVAAGVFPAAGVDYATTQWEPGEIVRAQFDLFLPADATPGGYLVSLRLVDQAGAPAAEMLTLTPFSVE